jgi:uncharacterized protein
MMKSSSLTLFLLVLGASSPAWAAPQFCGKPEGTAEQLICSDPELQSRYLSLAATYAAARSKAKPAQQKGLALEQKGWWNGVRDCWSADDLRACVITNYELHTVELQTGWALVPSHAPVHFHCADGDRHPARSGW